MVTPQSQSGHKLSQKRISQ